MSLVRRHLRHSSDDIKGIQLMPLPSSRIKASAGQENGFGKEPESVSATNTEESKYFKSSQNLVTTITKPSPKLTISYSSSPAQLPRSPGARYKSLASTQESSIHPHPSPLQIERTEDVESQSTIIDDPLKNEIIDDFVKWLQEEKEDELLSRQDFFCKRLRFLIIRHIVMRMKKHPDDGELRFYEIEVRDKLLGVLFKNEQVALNEFERDRLRIWCTVLKQANWFDLFVYYRRQIIELDYDPVIWSTWMELELELILLKYDPESREYIRDKKKRIHKKGVITRNEYPNGIRYRSLEWSTYRNRNAKEVEEWKRGQKELFHYLALISQDGDLQSRRYLDTMLCFDKKHDEFLPTQKAIEDIETNNPVHDVIEAWQKRQD